MIKTHPIFAVLCIICLMAVGSLIRKQAYTDGYTAGMHTAVDQMQAHDITCGEAVRSVIQTQCPDILDLVQQGKVYIHIYEQ